MQFKLSKRAMIATFAVMTFSIGTLSYVYALGAICGAAPIENGKVGACSGGPTCKKQMFKVCGKKTTTVEVDGKCEATNNTTGGGAFMDCECNTSGSKPPAGCKYKEIVPKLAMSDTGLVGDIA
jgi:hypothetical protein